MTGYSPYWIGQIAKRYNTEGPDGHAQSAAHDLPSRAAHARQLAQQEELRADAGGGSGAPERWTGSDVAAWISERLGRPVAYSLG